MALMFPDPEPHASADRDVVVWRGRDELNRIVICWVQHDVLELLAFGLSGETLEPDERLATFKEHQNLLSELISKQHTERGLTRSDGVLEFDRALMTGRFVRRVFRE